MQIRHLLPFFTLLAACSSEVAPAISEGELRTSVAGLYESIEYKLYEQEIWSVELTDIPDGDGFHYVTKSTTYSCEPPDDDAPGGCYADDLRAAALKPSSMFLRSRRRRSISTNIVRLG